MGVSVDRLRDRLLDHGAGALATDELVIVLSSARDFDSALVTTISDQIDIGMPPGRHTPDTSQFSRDSAAFLGAAVELVDRMGRAPAPEVVRGPVDVALIARREIGARCREHVVVIICDANNRVRQTVAISDGGTIRALMPVRETLSAVLRYDGRAFAVAHNHPSGSTEPSDADIVATRRLAEAARVLGLRFLGHVIVAGEAWAPVPS